MRQETLFLIGITGVTPGFLRCSVTRSLSRPRSGLGPVQLGRSSCPSWPSLGLACPHSSVEAQRFAFCPKSLPSPLL